MGLGLVVDKKILTIIMEHFSFTEKPIPFSTIIVHMVIEKDGGSEESVFVGDYDPRGEFFRITDVSYENPILQLLQFKEQSTDLSKLFYHPNVSTNKTVLNPPLKVPLQIGFLEFRNLKNATYTWEYKNKTTVEEDIQTVEKDPTQIKTVHNKSNPDVIMVALKKDISLFGSVKNITYDIATYVVQKDGKLLLFVPPELIDEPLCLLASKQNPEAIQFIPDQFKTEKMILQAVQHNGKLLEFVPHHLKIPPLFKIAFKQNPAAIEFIVPDTLKTEEMSTIAVQHDGNLLRYVPHKWKTEELCELAFDQTPKAVQYIPQPLLSKMLRKLIHKNKNVILYIPNSFLNKSLIEEVLESNPNVIYIPGMKEKIKRFIPDYEEAPLPPELARTMTSTFTDQSSEGVCGRHAFSRVIIKNIFELLFSLNMSSEYQKNMCNNFLNTVDTIQKPSLLNSLTPELCSQGGYLKILLFLHLFNLFQTHIPTADGLKKGWLRCTQVSDLYQFLYEPVSIPNINQTQHSDLTHILQATKKVCDEYKVGFVTFHFTDTDKELTLSNIKKITDHGLYIMLRIEDTTSKGEHAAHFVIIVGAIDEFILIKNSWGDEIIYKIKFDVPFFLNQYQFNKKTHCSFVIPISDEKNITFSNLTHVDEYLKKYEDFKYAFLNDFSKSCPSRDALPIECMNESQYRHQAFLFHPDKNPGCVDEATKKFKKLKTLRGCSRDDYVAKPRLLLTAGTRKKRKTRSSRK
jgi:hypothetical protein